MAKINHDMKGPRRRVPRMRWYTFVTSTPVSVTTAVKATRCTTTVSHNNTFTLSEAESCLNSLYRSDWRLKFPFFWGMTPRHWTIRTDVSSQPSALIFKGRNVKQQWLHTTEASREAVSSSHTQEIPRILWNSNVHSHVHKSSPLQVNPSSQSNFLRISKNNYFLYLFDRASLI